MVEKKEKKPDRSDYFMGVPADFDFHPDDKED